MNRTKGELHPGDEKKVCVERWDLSAGRFVLGSHFNLSW